MKFFLITCCLLFLSGCTAVQTPVTQNTTLPPGMFYFHSSTCPHCQNVNSFIEGNRVKEKIFFVSKEISSDKSGYELIQLVAKRCNIAEKDLGVPLFWDGATCYRGDEEIINYFKSKIQ